MFSLFTICGLQKEQATEGDSLSTEALISHPERSAAKSKDPAELPESNATGFLDFARNDSLAF